MPIYEFRCHSCGERFEALAEAGARSAPCRACGGAETVRVLSPQATPLRHVRSGAANRAQERKNAELRSRARAEFTARRRGDRRGRSGG
jgi:putative FmdB family regulatory protein